MTRKGHNGNCIPTTKATLSNRNRTLREKMDSKNSEYDKEIPHTAEKHGALRRRATQQS